MLQREYDERTAGGAQNFSSDRVPVNWNANVPAAGTNGTLAAAGVAANDNVVTHRDAPTAGTNATAAAADYVMCFQTPWTSRLYLMRSDQAMSLR